MITYENVERLLRDVENLLNREQPMRWKYHIEILDWGDGEGEKQIIVNADAIDEHGERTVFPTPIIDEVSSDLCDVAQSVFGLLNKAEKNSGRPQVWQQYFGGNWWDLDGEETDDDHNISTIQYCIFNDNTED